MLVQAVLLDRDGVINQERADYVKSWEEFEFLPSVLPALTRLAELARPILVISNQSAIGRGLTTRDRVDDIHRRLTHIIEANGGRVDGFYLCPHHPNFGCECRKPKPGLLLMAAKDFHLDLAKCVFVGDSITDYQAAQAAGCPSVLLETGRQGPQLHSLLAEHCTDTPIVSDLAAAVNLIITNGLSGVRPNGYEQTETKRPVSKILNHSI